MTRLLIIDQDAIFRLGLRTICEQFPPLQVVADVSDSVAGLQFIQEHPTLVSLVILDWENPESGLAFCQAVKSLETQIQILLITNSTHATELALARQIGINGYCRKGIGVSELINGIQRVAAGEQYWQTENLGKPSPGKLITWRSQLGKWGLRQIDRNLAGVKTELESLQLFPASDWRQLVDRAILQGQKRELLAAQWMIRQLLFVGETPPLSAMSSPAEVRQNPETPAPGGSLQLRTQSGRELLPPEVITDVQSALFDISVAKLRSRLVNLTGFPLEIDILRVGKRRDLMLLILKRLENLLDELRFSQVQQSQLFAKRNLLLLDLWESVITEFFGKYYTINNISDDVIFPTRELSSLPSFNHQESVVPRLLEKSRMVEQEILNKIPWVVEWLEHLLFQVPLLIDHQMYQVGSPEAMKRAEIILENLMIQVANAVLQPLLNQFADVEEIKQGFYDRHLLSTREIERFRNQLSWRYRLQFYFKEPKAIFESRLELLVFNERGIQEISVYASRHPELESLSGVPLILTLALETRDAVAPQIRSIVALLGAGVVYLLTQVIGRGIGLISRGVLQGIGKSVKD